MLVDDPRLQVGQGQGQVWWCTSRRPLSLHTVLCTPDTRPIAAPACLCPQDGMHQRWAAAAVAEQVAEAVRRFQPGRVSGQAGLKH